MEAENISRKNAGILPGHGGGLSLIVNPVEAIGEFQQRIAVEDPVPECGAADFNRNVNGQQAVVIRFGKHFQIFQSEIRIADQFHPIVVDAFLNNKIFFAGGAAGNRGRKTQGTYRTHQKSHIHSLHFLKMTT